MTEGSDDNIEGLDELAEDLLKKEKKKAKLEREAEEDPFTTPDEPSNELSEEELMKELEELGTVEKKTPEAETKTASSKLGEGKSELELKDEGVSVSVRQEGEPAQVSITTTKKSTPKTEETIEEKPVSINLEESEPVSEPATEPQLPETQPTETPKTEETPTKVEEPAPQTPGTPAVKEPEPEIKESKLEEKLQTPPKSPNPFDKIIDLFKEHKKKVIIGGGALVGLILLIILISLLLPSETLDMQTGEAGESFTAEFTTKQEVTSVKFSFTHTDSGTITEKNARKEGNKWVADNIKLMRSGEWTLNVKSGSAILYTRVVNLPAECSSDNDCNDLCCYGACTTPECSSATDCDDGDSCSIETCISPGTCEAICEYEIISDNIMGDNCCPQGATFAEDSDCTTCPSSMILCNQSCITPECKTNTDCTDYDYSTTDVCENPGTCEATCYNVPGGPCDDEEIICNNKCTVPVCTNNEECNDSDPFTNDTCLNPGTCNSICRNTAGACTNNLDCDSTMWCCDNLCTAPQCTLDEECDDGDSTTTDTCVNPDSCNAYCSNNECDIACSSNSQCTDGRTCYYPGTCDSFCAHCENDDDCIGTSICCNGECESIQCYSNSECSFGETCYNAGACGSECRITSCTTYTNCMSGLACCSSTCTPLVCGEQTWSNVRQNTTLMIGGENVSNIYLTLHNPSDDSFLIKIFNQSRVLLNSRKQIPYTYSDAHTGFNVTVSSYNTGTGYATVSWKTYCPKGTYCKDYNTCTSGCVECTSNTHCEEGESCCNNTCTATTCSAAVTGKAEMPGLTSSAFYNNYMYFADSSTVKYYDGFLQSTSSNPGVIELAASATNLYTLNSTEGSVKKLSGTSWNLLVYTKGYGQSLLSTSAGIYFGLGNGTVFKYDESLTELTIIGAALETNVTELSYYDNKVLAGLSNGKLYAFEGSSWVLKNTFEAGIKCSTVDDSTIYVGLLNGKVYKSTDLATWESNTLNSEASVQVLNYISGKLFAGLSNGEIYYNTGTDWYKLEQAGGGLIGIHNYAGGVHLLDSTYGVSRLETTGCSDSYCINEGTCTASCIT